MPIQQISSGTPPLLWSNVDEAFTKINANFETLAASIAGGGSLIDFEQFDNNIIPTTSNNIRLGDIIKPWKRLHVDSYRDNSTDTMNGLWLGSAHIRGIDTSVDLPLGSTVNGELIIDPNKTFFKRVSVDDFNVIEANEFSDTLNLTAGTAMQLVVDSAAERITINNVGVTSLIAGTAINVNSSTGNITITNTGVTSLTNSTSLPSGLVAGSGISVSSSNGSVLLTNTGVLEVQQGFGITVSTDLSTGIATISNSAPAQVTFRNYVINGDNLNAIVADSTSDTMYINTGYGLIATKDPSIDTLNIALDQRIDIIGSVFGDDSTKIVDAVENKVYGGIFATTLRTSEFEIALGQGAGGDGLQGSESIAIGMSAGAFTQGAYAVAIGSGAGNVGQGDRAIAIGATAGVDQGDYAISIGNGAGYPTAVAQSIAINASGFTLDAPAAGFYVNPIRASTTSARPIVYDTTTKELKYTSTLEFVNSTISTSDSSGITVDVVTTFNTDIIVENDLNVTQRIVLQGSRVINISELKSLVAASTDFADFKTRIAALV